MGWSLGDFASCQTKPLTAYMGVVLSGQILSFVSDWQRFSGMHIPVDFVRFHEYDKQQIEEGCFELNHGI